MVYLAFLPPDIPKKSRPSAQTQAGRALLRHALLQAGLPVPQDLSPLLAFGPKGKPSLPAGWPCFNISHAHRAAVCAVDSGPVGVDVERVRSFPPHLAARILGPGEEELIAAQPCRDSALTQLWTAKESYMKFTGLGFAQGIQQTAFCRLGPFPQLPAGTPGFASVSFTDPEGRLYWLTQCGQNLKQLQLERVELPAPST